MIRFVSRRRRSHIGPGVNFIRPVCSFTVQRRQPANRPADARRRQLLKTAAARAVQQVAGRQLQRIYARMDLHRSEQRTPQIQPAAVHTTSAGKPYAPPVRPGPLPRLRSA